MKRALVLSGGGSKGAFEAGAIEYLVCEEGLDFQVFLGTSVGALNAAFLGQARNHRELSNLARELRELWLGIKGNSSIYNRRIFGVLNLLCSDSLYTPNGLRRLLNHHLDLRRIFNPATVVKVAAVAHETGELFYADSRHPELRADFLDYVLASASMPLFFPAVPISGKHWYDGGLRDITPLGAAFAEHPDEIVVIITYPVDERLQPLLPRTKYGGVFGSVLRTVEIITSEIATNDLQLADTINRYHWAFPRRRRVPIRLIAPNGPLAGSNALDFRPDGIKENLKQGYEAAQNPRILRNTGDISNSHELVTFDKILKNPSPEQA